ncbi:serine/threonine-protein kinase [Nonomuraea africana]|uniref:non-specific serine/threonine protein kinase n=1 Tax=Nonomuraea africana TaxID=46171 RepID=A0ABR9KHB0_9ACTN|nr:serine/threonine-protein kinase [Nonomuraea africana]MBE1561395.1 serine/threonine protein kinase [Nonomuraea africana]
MSDGQQHAGRRIAGRYHLKEPIGKGGMGIVWRAHDELLDREVAVKEVRYAAVLGDEVQLLNRRTMREARAAARFTHPNVIVVHDVIEEDDRPWIVMQLVPSRSLGQVIKAEGPLPPKKVAEIGLAVLDALRGAHEAGVLHRDVKPENVLLAEDGRVVLTDFGIATLETETALTMTGLAGTPAFIAPERLKGLPARRESDLWSLGATLYTAVEGRAPHERGMAMATMMAVLNDDPEPPKRAGALKPVLAGLLAKEPDERLGFDETARLLRRAAAESGNETVRVTRPAPVIDVDDTPTDPSLPAIASPVPSPAPSSPPPPPPTVAKERAEEMVETGMRLPDATTPGATPTPAARRALPVIAAVVGVVVVGGVAGILGLRSAGQAGPETSKRPTQEVTTTVTATATATSSPDQPAPSPSPSPSASKTESALPDGWRMYKDKELDFSVGLPKGWDVYDRRGNQVYFRGPGASSNSFLLIEQATDPGDDPYKDWKQQEPGARGNFGGYKLIGIEKVDYMKAAADWEFTWNTNTGKTRVRNRGFITDNGRGYAIYWHTLEKNWKRDLRFFDTFAATFKPSK